MGLSPRSPLFRKSDDECNENYEKVLITQAARDAPVAIARFGKPDLDVPYLAEDHQFEPRAARRRSLSLNTPDTGPNLAIDSLEKK